MRHRIRLLLTFLAGVYKGLLEEVRRKLALRYLKDRRISLKQVAYLLGYSEVSAFYHAFRRWTGSSPVQHRLKS